MSPAHSLSFIAVFVSKLFLPLSLRPAGFPAAGRHHLETPAGMASSCATRRPAQELQGVGWAGPAPEAGAEDRGAGTWSHPGCCW